MGREAKTQRKQLVPAHARPVLGPQALRTLVSSSAPGQSLPF